MVFCRVKDIDPNLLVAIGTIVLVIVGIVTLGVIRHQGKQAKRVADDIRRIADETKRKTEVELEKEENIKNSAVGIKLVGGRNCSPEGYDFTVQLLNYTANPISMWRIELFWWLFDRPHETSNRTIALNETLAPNQVELRKKLSLSTREASMNRNDLEQGGDLPNKLRGLLNFNVKAVYKTVNSSAPGEVETGPQRWI